ncbi:hypothetical protein GJ496_004815 [Pomphorhynchus laevis]|nr:hypothetical protein GJ496_004815 [Pomphorhynchus laevis]
MSGLLNALMASIIFTLLVLSIPYNDTFQYQPYNDAFQCKYILGKLGLQNFITFYEGNHQNYDVIPPWWKPFNICTRFYFLSEPFRSESGVIVHAYDALKVEHIELKFIHADANPICVSRSENISFAYISKDAACMRRKHFSIPTDIPGEIYALKQLDSFTYFPKFRDYYRIGEHQDIHVISLERHSMYCAQNSIDMWVRRNFTTFYNEASIKAIITEISRVMSIMLNDFRLVWLNMNVFNVALDYQVKDRKNEFQLAKFTSVFQIDIIDNEKCDWQKAPRSISQRIDVFKGQETTLQKPPEMYWRDLPLQRKLTGYYSAKLYIGFEIGCLAYHMKGIPSLRLMWWRWEEVYRENHWVPILHGICTEIYLDFIERSLSMNTSERLSLEDQLKHPFIDASYLYKTHVTNMENNITADELARKHNCTVIEPARSRRTEFELGSPEYSDYDYSDSQYDPIKEMIRRTARQKRRKQLQEEKLKTNKEKPRNIETKLPSAKEAEIKRFGDMLKMLGNQDIGEIIRNEDINDKYEIEDYQEENKENFKIDDIKKEVKMISTNKSANSKKMQKSNEAKSKIKQEKEKYDKLIEENDQMETYKIINVDEQTTQSTIKEIELMKQNQHDKAGRFKIEKIKNEMQIESKANDTKREESSQFIKNTNQQTDKSHIIQESEQPAKSSRFRVVNVEKQMVQATVDEGVTETKKTNRFNLINVQEQMERKNEPLSEQVHKPGRFKIVKIKDEMQIDSKTNEVSTEEPSQFIKNTNQQTDQSHIIQASEQPAKPSRFRVVNVEKQMVQATVDEGVTETKKTNRFNVINLQEQMERKNEPLSEQVHKPGRFKIVKIKDKMQIDSKTNDVSTEEPSQFIKNTNQQTDKSHIIQASEQPAKPSRFRVINVERQMVQATVDEEVTETKKTNRFNVINVQEQIERKNEPLSEQVHKPGRFKIVKIKDEMQIDSKTNEVSTEEPSQFIKNTNQQTDQSHIIKASEQPAKPSRFRVINVERQMVQASVDEGVTETKKTNRFNVINLQEQMERKNEPLSEQVHKPGRFKIVKIKDKMQIDSKTNDVSTEEPSQFIKNTNQQTDKSHIIQASEQPAKPSRFRVINVERQMVQATVDEEVTETKKTNRFNVINVQEQIERKNEPLSEQVHKPGRFKIVKIKDEMQIDSKTNEVSTEEPSQFIKNTNQQTDQSHIIKASEQPAKPSRFRVINVERQMVQASVDEGVTETKKTDRFNVINVKEKIERKNEPLSEQVHKPEPFKIVKIKDKMQIDSKTNDVSTEEPSQFIKNTNQQTDKSHIIQASEQPAKPSRFRVVNVEKQMVQAAVDEGVTETKKTNRFNVINVQEQMERKNEPLSEQVHKPGRFKIVKIKDEMQIDSKTNEVSTEEPSQFIKNTNQQTDQSHIIQASEQPAKPSRFRVVNVEKQMVQATVDEGVTETKKTNRFNVINLQEQMERKNEPLSEQVHKPGRFKIVKIKDEMQIDSKTNDVSTEEPSQFIKNTNQQTDQSHIIQASEQPAKPSRFRVINVEKQMVQATVDEGVTETKKTNRFNVINVQEQMERKNEPLSEQVHKPGRFKIVKIKDEMQIDSKTNDVSTEEPSQFIKNTNQQTDQSHIIQASEQPAKPSRFRAINVEKQMVQATVDEGVTETKKTNRFNVINVQEQMERKNEPLSEQVHKPGRFKIVKIKDEMQIDSKTNDVSTEEPSQFIKNTNQQTDQSHIIQASEQPAKPSRFRVINVEKQMVQATVDEGVTETKKTNRFNVINVQEQTERKNEPLSEQVHKPGRLKIVKIKDEMQIDSKTNDMNRKESSHFIMDANQQTDQSHIMPSSDNPSKPSRFRVVNVEKQMVFNVINVKEIIEGKNEPLSEQVHTPGRFKIVKINDESQIDSKANDISGEEPSQFIKNTNKQIDQSHIIQASDKPAIPNRLRVVNVQKQI